MRARIVEVSFADGNAAGHRHGTGERVMRYRAVRPPLPCRARLALCPIFTGMWVLAQQREHVCTALFAVEAFL